MGTRVLAISLTTAILTGPTWAGDEESISLRGQKTREVWTLAVYEGPDGAHGQCDPLKISVTPDGSPMFRVGIYESEVGGTGNMWRSAAWMSTAAAALATGFAPSARNVTFDVTGRIDGPSAGAIMTVGVLAAVRGDTVRADAAMTGMINPDFSIGPVGGVPHKIEGAAKAGRTLVLIPASSRVDYDKNLQRDVDLIDLGKRLKVEVRPVADLYEAYRIMTGKDLTREPATDQEPTVSAEIRQAIQLRTREWINRYQQYKTQFDNLPDDAKSEAAVETIGYATELAQRSERLAREDDVAAAYRLAFEATFNSVDALEAARLSDIYQRLDLDAVLKELEATSRSWAKIDVAVLKLKNFTPKTLMESSAFLDATSCLIEAINMAILADDMIKREAADDDERLENLVQAGIYYQYSQVDLLGLEESLADMRGGSGPAPSEERVALAAQLFRRAAEANVAMFESMYIDKRAESEGLTASAMTVKLMDEDFRYGQLKLGLRLLSVLENQFGKGLQMDYATLTAMRDAYVASTLLIAKYYSLQAVEEEGQIVSVGREQSLRLMLDFSQNQAKRSIAYLASKGVDTSSPASSYLVGRLKREGTVHEKLDGLSYFWSAHMSAQVLSLLGGFAAGVQ